MDWVRGESLGHGSFATVSLAKPRKQNPQLPPLMAVKSCGASHSASLINEETILCRLSGCEQIIQCFGSDFSFQNGEKLCNLLLEYASGGSLSEKIRRSGHRSLPEYELRRYTKSILKGILYIHKQGYVHCDIKPQNILLCSDNDFSEIAKIGDFGLAKRAGLGREKFELRGTPMYMSPEMTISGEQEAPADIWALGCLVAEMASGAPAWKFPVYADMEQLLMRIGVGDEIPEIPSDLSDDGKDFLGKCFVRDTEKRWTAEMLLDHPFVDDHNNDDVHVTLAPDRCSDEACSSSPKCPFDFPGWDDISCEITFLPLSGYDSSTSIVERVQGIECNNLPEWHVTDSWVTIR